MSNTRPAWVDDVLACDRRGEDLRHAQAALADERARIIDRAVQGYDRGVGRPLAAKELGVQVRQIDAAIKRARNSPPPSGLPYDLLDRLYALELADIPPLPALLWQSLAHVLMGTFIDVTWVEQPGRILAQEVEDAAGEDLDEDNAKHLADAARSWSRIQALAVIDAIQRRHLDALPTEPAQ